MIKKLLFVFVLYFSSNVCNAGFQLSFPDMLRYDPAGKQRLQPSSKLCDLVKLNKVKEVELFLKKLDDSGSINQAGNDGEPALHWAAISGFVDMVKLLLDNGADPNQLDMHGDTALHSAAICEEEEAGVEVAKLLFKQGATNINQIDQLGYVALHSAAFHNNAKIIELFCENGAIEKINHICNKNLICNENLTPLDAAIYKKSWEAVKILKELGAKKSIEL